LLAYRAKDRANERRWHSSGKIKMIKIPEREMAKIRRVAGRPIWNKWVADNRHKFASQELLDLVLEKAAEK
jgi:hypothetical protein